MPINLSAIQNAKLNFPPEVKETKLEKNERLSALYGAEIYLKREDQQPVRSYKIRGAYNAISNSPDPSKKVIAASAGNHAQGVAFSCKVFQRDGIIFMPKTTPQQKIDATLHHGGGRVTVELVGDTFDEAKKESEKYVQKHGGDYIHPFDDPRTICGQGTIALEILSQMPNESSIDIVIGPVGGGGLMGGMSTVFKAMSPKTKLIGVEPASVPSYKMSLEANTPVSVEAKSTFVDGACVSLIGNHSFKAMKTNKVEPFLIDENQLCTTMLDLLNKDGIIVEPAGAMSIRALEDHKESIKGKTVVCIISGGNLDFSRLPEIQNRSQKAQGRLKWYLIQFAQRPGALREMLDDMTPRQDIVRFEYIKKINQAAGPALVVLESSDPKDFPLFESRLKKRHITFQDITHTPLLHPFLQ